MLDRIKEISNNLKSQDNLCTGNPIFVVQQRRRIYGMDPEYSDEPVWLDDYSDHEEVTDQKTIDFLNKNWVKTGIEPEGYIRTGYMDIWEFVTACLTRRGAEEYIRINNHNLTEPRIYVESGKLNPEWAAIRNYFLNL